MMASIGEFDPLNTRVPATKIEVTVSCRKYICVNQKANLKRNDVRLICDLLLCDALSSKEKSFTDSPDSCKVQPMFQEITADIHRRVCWTWTHSPSQILPQLLPAVCVPPLRLSSRSRWIFGRAELRGSKRHGSNVTAVYDGKEVINSVGAMQERGD
ncbi:hypothetical protein D9C73_011153 [Collichthys lucidus]|uniref:Uncharacterized protein n=1 Tax=Collichthys lucidus TaxID=240159 RepID=A0A4V6APK4_COLLU|nr:hypothetical protein D9C73_011153 [Collichthys lucidus]